jgi:hypothetical protein
MEDLEEITRFVDKIETMARIMPALEWEDQIPNLAGTNTGANLDMETIILTSLAVNATTKHPRFRPLIISELLSFLTLTTRHKGSIHTLVPSFTKDMETYLLGLNDTLDQAVVADLASSLAIRLEEEIGGLKDLDQLDPRFITCFTVKLKP